MKIKNVYICDNCGKEFENKNDCDRHETICSNKHQKFRENVVAAIQKAKNKYRSIVVESSYKTDEEIEEYNYHNSSEYELYKFEIKLKLSNGNNIFIYDGCNENLWLGNYLSEEVIYNSLEKAIENGLSTTYIGIIDWDYGEEENWRTDYIGETHLSDIVDRLRGRKVKLEVIE